MFNDVYDTGEQAGGEERAGGPNEVDVRQNQDWDDGRLYTPRSEDPGSTDPPGH